VIAVAVLLLEQRHAAEADRRDLLLTVGLGVSFVGIDLRGRDLSRAYLVSKNFSGARFDGANLKGADLAGAVLSRASLKDTDLRGTNFQGSPLPLFPSPQLLPGPNVFPSSGAPAGTQQVGDAILGDVDVRDATYDDSTGWPENFDPGKEGAVHVNCRSLWWRIRHFSG
jgi:uncharacterized protein YjbI with pentapeptide repeats